MVDFLCQIFISIVVQLISARDFRTGLMINILDGTLVSLLMACCILKKNASLCVRRNET